MKNRAERRLRSGKQAGFTLIETLVTLALTSLIGVIIAQALWFSHRQTTTQVSKLRRERVTAVLFDRISRDVRDGAVVASTPPQTVIVRAVRDTTRYVIHEGVVLRNGFTVTDQTIECDSLIFGINNSDRELTLVSCELLYRWKGHAYVETRHLVSRR